MDMSSASRSAVSTSEANKFESAPAAEMMSSSSQTASSFSSRARFRERPLSFRELFDVAAAGLLAKTLQMNASFLPSTLGLVENAVFLLPLLSQSTGFLGIAQPAGQLARRVAIGTIGQIRRHPRGECGNVLCKLRSVAVDAADSTQEVAALIHGLPQFTHQIQDIVSLLGSGVFFQTNANHPLCPIFAPRLECGIGSYKRELRLIPLRSSISELAFQFGPNL